jgi:hypothetical protein
LEQRICKMRLEHFVMPNGKEVLKKFLQWKNSQRPNLEQFVQQNKIPFI